LVEKTGYLSLFDADTEENVNKRMNLDEFQNSILEFCKINEGATLSDYLNSVTLSSDIDNINEEDNVSVATIHAVKGLEFRCVFIAGLEETIFPISRSVADNDELEEERRLMYVAITRAREKLYMTRSRSRFLYGDRAYMTESRFFKEVKGVISPSSAIEDKKQTTTGRSVYAGDKDDLGTSASYGGFSTAKTVGMFKETKPQSTGEKDYSEFKSGAKVNHTKFGVGTIILVKGSGKNIICDVAFKGIGVKSLAVQFAPMTIIK
jgi:DNA helicase-2/ATP-dependent DNA helicase PcrA